MVSKGQIVGIDWNRIMMLLVSSHEPARGVLAHVNSLTAGGMDIFWNYTFFFLCNETTLNLY